MTSRDGLGHGIAGGVPAEEAPRRPWRRPEKLPPHGSVAMPTETGCSASKSSSIFRR